MRTFVSHLDECNTQLLPKALGCWTALVMRCAEQARPGHTFVSMCDAIDAARPDWRLVFPMSPRVSELRPEFSAIE